MGLTPDDIRAQRALLQRGDEIRQAQEQAAEKMRLRDQFAAAAMTGLLSSMQKNAYAGEVSSRAYYLADSMILERDRTNHDAAPAATARTDADRHRTDKAASRPCEGTGDIVTRLRQTRANMIGTDDEDHYWDCHDAADEIERLRNRSWPTLRYVRGVTEPVPKEKQAEVSVTDAEPLQGS